MNARGANAPPRAGRTPRFSMGSVTEPHAFEPLPLWLRRVPVDLKRKKAWSQSTCLERCWARAGPLEQLQKPSAELHALRQRFLETAQLLGTSLQNPKGQM